MVTRYSGTLYYLSKDDELRVQSLILRTDSVAFQATTTWAGEGVWSVDTVAPRVEPGVYVAAAAIATQGTKSNRCRLELRIKESDPDRVEVTGCWIERGKEYPFDGELEEAVK